MSRSTSPTYIVGHPADTAGCAYHRIIRPIELMTRAGYCSGRFDMQIWTDNRIQAVSPDIIVWQRQHEDFQIEAMKKVRELVPAATHIYEIDDCLSAVPDWSPHRAAIPYGVDERMRKGIEVCDIVTVTTTDLADHIRGVCGEVDVRVAPNMLGKDELQRIGEIRGMKPPGAGSKPRVGWGGGHSHKGDLDLLIPMMRELHNRVEFVFLGQKPDCEVPCEFHQGVPPQQYLSYFAGLGLDLILAPLVDCKFNRCKSNLRLLEAAAIGVPVVASPVAPYLTNNPPVLYADTDSQWIDHVLGLLADKDKLLQKGVELTRWMQRRYVLDDHLEERLRYWLPKNVKPFVPKRRQSVNEIVIVCPSGNLGLQTKKRVVKTLREAVSLTANILYLRPGTAYTDEYADRLLRQLVQGDTASVMPLSNDGGVASFPRVGVFTPIDPSQREDMDAVCKSLFEPVKAEVSNPAGPMVLMSRRCMELCGYPDLEMTDVESALIEWGVMVAAKGFVNVATANLYVTTGGQHFHPDVQTLLNRCQLRYQVKNLPTDPFAPVRYDLELAYHKDHYFSPLPSQNVSYAEWAALFSELGETDLHWMSENMPDVQVEHMTFPVSKEDLLRDVTGEPGGRKWVLLTAQTTKLLPQALYTFAKAIAESGDPQKVLFYADNDFEVQENLFDRHDFKPVTLDRHLLLQRDYVTPVFAVFLPTLLELADNLPDLIMEATLYGVILDVVELAGAKRVQHVPRILAHLTPDQNIQAVMALADLKTAEATKRCENTGCRVRPHPRFPFLGELSYAPALADELPMVSVIMPTGGRTEILSPGLKTLLTDTDYPNMEVLVVENGKLVEMSHQFLEETAAQDPRVRLFEYPKKYNWSAINNWASDKAKGEYLLFLNDDTRVLEPHWLREMVGAAMQPGVGAVGARLLYPHGLVQHVGVVCREGLSGHLHKGMPEGNPGYNGIAILSHEATAVTGACLLIKKDLFNEVGRLDEELAHNFNDVAMCLELNRLGYANVVAARAQLHHLEGVTRASAIVEEGLKILLKEGEIIRKKYGKEPEPYWNPNLFFVHSEGGAMVSGLNCEILQWPAPAWEHRKKDWPRESILLVGDDGSGWIEEARKGNVLYFSVLQGFAMTIARPGLINVAPFDVRESATPQEVVAKLGITKIIVRSILGGIVETLPFILKLGLPVEYRPFTAEAACPRLDFQTRLPDAEQFADCNGGWQRGECQPCLANCGSPFGVVSLTGWRDQWRKFMEAAEVTEAASEAARLALAEIYPGTWDIRQAAE